LAREILKEAETASVTYIFSHSTGDATPKNRIVLKLADIIAIVV
jgi:hypothetical protein